MTLEHVNAFLSLVGVGYVVFIGVMSWKYWKARQ